MKEHLFTSEGWPPNLAAVEISSDSETHAVQGAFRWVVNRRFGGGVSWPSRLGIGHALAFREVPLRQHRESHQERRGALPQIRRYKFLLSRDFR